MWPHVYSCPSVFFSPSHPLLNLTNEWLVSLSWWLLAGHRLYNISTSTHPHINLLPKHNPSCLQQWSHTVNAVTERNLHCIPPCTTHSCTYSPAQAFQFSISSKERVNTSLPPAFITSKQSTVSRCRSSPAAAAAAHLGFSPLPCSLLSYSPHVPLHLPLL